MYYQQVKHQEFTFHFRSVDLTWRGRVYLNGKANLSSKVDLLHVYAYSFSICLP